MPTILHAEDDPQVSDLVRLLFTKESGELHVRTVTNGRDCLEALAAGGIDLLLLDLVLPGRDGLSILSELAKRGDHTPVIVLSSHGQYDQTVSALRAGAVDCIDKKGRRFMDIARIVNTYLASPLNAKPSEGEPHSVVLLEPQEQAAQELAAVVEMECPGVRLRVLRTRTEWDKLVALKGRCDALILSDQWELEDLTDVLRDFRSLCRGAPSILLCRLNRVEVVIAAYALGCRDCIVHRQGYQLEVARSLNHLLRPSWI